MRGCELNSYNTIALRRHDTGLVETNPLELAEMDLGFGIWDLVFAVSPRRHVAASGAGH
jgi:hypothetical protein